MTIERAYTCFQYYNKTKVFLRVHSCVLLLYNRIVGKTKVCIFIYLSPLTLTRFISHNLSWELSYVEI